MNQSIQPDPVRQKVINFLPVLVELGHTGDCSSIDESQLPDPWDFGRLHKNWGLVVSGWGAAQVAELIKGLTYFESMFGRGFGSVPPVAELYRIYELMVDATEQQQLAEWILANTCNNYTPYGTANHGARSLQELKKNKDEYFARKQASAAREKASFEDARKKRCLEATDRLPKALRRRDHKAVAALLAKGADVDAVGPSGQSAREIARELGLDDYLATYL